MSTLTVYSDLVDGYIGSDSAVYLTARAGGGNLGVSTGADSIVQGQSLGYNCFEGFISFDTSSIGAGTVTAATLSLYAKSDYSVVDFTVYARARDWGASLTTADWVAGADLSALPLLASVTTAGLSVAAYTALSSESAFVSNINTSGSTRIILTSARHEAGNCAGAGSAEHASA